MELFLKARAGIFGKNPGALTKIKIVIELFLGPAKTYKRGLSWRSARTPTIRTITGTSVIKMGFAQLRGGPVPVTVPITRPLFHCPIVGHSLGFN